MEEGYYDNAEYPRIESAEFTEEEEEVVYEEEGDEQEAYEYEEVEPSEIPEWLQGPVLSRSNILENRVSSSTNAGEAQQQPTEQPIVEEPPPKRKRGRPRKNSTGTVSFGGTQTFTPAPPTASELRAQRRKEEGENIAAQYIPILEKKIKEERKKQGGVDWEINVALEEEERKQKETLMRKIEMYYKYFPEECFASSTRKSKWSYRTATQELEDEIRRCQKELDIKRAITGVHKAHLAFVYGLEKLAIHGFGVPVYNLAHEVSLSDEMFQEELAEIAIEHIDWFTMGAKTRYAYNLFMIFNRVLTENQRKMAGMQAQGGYDEKVNEYSTKYADL